jgi:aspartate racemase
VRLVAYVVPLPDTRPVASQLRSFLKKDLPEAMVPSAFVTLDEFPRTPSGKVDRLSLPEPGTHPSRTESVAAPRDALELQLAKLWEKILQVRPVGRDDDFFDLGGDSILAVSLFVEIEETFGRKLPLATLFEAATVAKLAAILRREGWMPRWTSLVPIQPGGIRTPFFCVHGGGGQVLFYRTLARNLGSDRPFYGLQARGLNGVDRPHARVESMASDYVREIRGLQPEGPYLIGGGSFGAMVAFEMARQLHGQGDTVARVIMFDGGSPAYLESSHNPVDAPTPLRRFAQRAQRRWVEVSRAAPEERGPYVRATTAKAAGIAWRRIKERTILPPAIRATQRAIHEARRRYVPEVCPAPIVLFRTGERRNDFRFDPALGWAELAGGGLEIHEIPGRHLQMYEDPGVRLLASQLKKYLDLTA